MTSACNNEKNQLIILFGTAKYLKVSVILFKSVTTFFAQNLNTKSFLSRIKKRWLNFTLEVFHIQLLKETQNPSKLKHLDCGCLANFSEILKIISEFI